MLDAALSNNSMQLVNEAISVLGNKYKVALLVANAMNASEKQAKGVTELAYWQSIIKSKDPITLANHDMYLFKLPILALIRGQFNRNNLSPDSDITCPTYFSRK